MSENIESWSRTRRNSGHDIDIALSSDSESVASSAGPSSFTDNLTLYMRGERNLQEKPQSSKAKESHESNESNESNEVNTSSHHHDARSSLNMDEEMAATLKRHDELMAENKLLKQELEQALAINKERRAAEEARERASTTKSDTTTKQSEAQADHQAAYEAIESATARADAARQQVEVNLMRISELEEKLTEKDGALRTHGLQKLQYEDRIKSLQKTVDQARTQDKDDLTDQSLIEELEDELERTRHELERKIKDKERAERQVGFLEADLAFERNRNSELQAQLTAMRASLSTPNMKLPSNATLGETQDALADLSKLRQAVEKADLRLENLEAQVGNAEATASQQHRAGTQVPTNTSRSRIDAGIDHVDSSPGIPSANDAKARKADKAKRETHDTIAKMRKEMTEIQRRYDESLALNRTGALQIKKLQAEVDELQLVKARMGRVLMYQWGKEEVGEIERAGPDGAKERGMGYRYKYYNKDGTLKR